jgi:hypothetical protein
MPAVLAEPEARGASQELAEPTSEARGGVCGGQDICHQGSPSKRDKSIFVMGEDCTAAFAQRAEGREISVKSTMREDSPASSTKYSKSSQALSDLFSAARPWGNIGYDVVQTQREMEK